MTASNLSMTRPTAEAEIRVKRPGISSPVLGMLLFITSEVMFFAGLFAAYFNARALSPVWPPPGNPAFDLTKDIPLMGPMTLVLVASSFTCQWGVRSIQRGDRRGLTRAIAVTVALGIVFLLGSLYDYMTIGFVISDGPFGSTFYTLTGFHAFHVLAGAIMLSVILFRSSQGQFSARHHDAVEAVSLYWHFVDVVWICLFSLLFLLPLIP